MATRIELTESFLHALANSSERQRKLLLRHASKEQLTGLFELCLNLLRGQLPVDPVNFQRLKRHRKCIETLSKRRVPLYKKKEILNQRGGFVGQLAAFALPILTNIIAGQIGKRLSRKR